jgi:hypothetical protein
LHALYSIIGGLVGVAAAIMGIAALVYFFGNLLHDQRRRRKALLSIVVWLPISVVMTYAWMLGALLIWGWNQQDPVSALYGAVVVIVATAIYAGVLHFLKRWIQSDERSATTA